MNNRFSVAMRAVMMAFRFKLSAQLGMVVYLSVIYNPDVLFFVRNRLLSALHIDNAQAAHGKADILFDEKTLIIRPTMQDTAIHRGQHIAAHMPITTGENNAADSTHRSSWKNNNPESLLCWNTFAVSTFCRRG